MTAAAEMQHPSGLASRSALRFVVFLGVVSLFGDMTYEGARSVTGPWLAALGASAAIVGVVAGAGELVGYALRLGSGLFADRTHRYWSTTLVGYAINLFSVPLLALTGSWPAAAGLIIVERAGRAIRKPAGDAMLSHAGGVIGHGWAFGLREALDQTGAVLGPLIVALVISRHLGYRVAFASLAVPAALAFVFLLIAQRQFPRPRELEVKITRVTATEGISRRFWIYTVAGAFVAAGTVDFPLVAFHFAKHAIVSAASVPLLYALAMGSAAISAPAIGVLLDRRGMPVLVTAVVVTAAAAPMLFLGGSGWAVAGAAIWGLSTSLQDATVRAMLARIVSPDHRASAYGIFDATFGIAWFLGSATMGLLYGVAPGALVICSVVLQLLSVPLFLLAQ
jgi:predicted MFS family arabinose efflux permease